jgi:hypothetical protein
MHAVHCIQYLRFENSTSYRLILGSSRPSAIRLILRLPVPLSYQESINALPLAMGPTVLHVLVLPLIGLFTTTVALQPAVRAVSLRERDLLCPIPCDGIWCCITGQTCQPASGPGVPFNCADILLETTDLAYTRVVNSELSSFISSLESALSRTLTFTTPTYNTFLTPSTRPPPPTPTATVARPSTPTSSSSATQLVKGHHTSTALGLFGIILAFLL